MVLDLQGGLVAKILSAQAVSVSDTGRVRARNEDRIFTSERLFVVADGMGGHTLGDVAAQCAIDAVAAIEQDLDSYSVEDRKSAIKIALIEAADQICRHLDGVLPGSTETRILNFGQAAGTTVAGLHLGERPLAFHVGDSRVYLYRDQELSRLTRDHSLVQEMVDAGEITDDEAHTHPRRSIITRAIGTYGPPAVDFAEVDLKVGDFVILCSDGLTDELTDAEMTRILRDAIDMDEAINRLVSEALASGGRDNISIVLAHIGE